MVVILNGCSHIDRTELITIRAKNVGIYLDEFHVCSKNVCLQDKRYIKMIIEKSSVTENKILNRPVDVNFYVKKFQNNMLKIAFNFHEYILNTSFL